MDDILQKDSVEYDEFYEEIISHGYEQYRQSYLKNREFVNTDNGERVILTFDGDKNFVLIEEMSNVSEEFEIIPVYGDPLMLNDTIGALSTNSFITYTSNTSRFR